MSRVGRKPIEIPAGVDVKLADGIIWVKKDENELNLKLHPTVEVKIEGNIITVSRKNEQKVSKSMQGLTRTLISNMVNGVHTAFTKILEIQGTGYRAQLNGDLLNLTLGLSHPVEIKAPAGISFEVPAPNRIIVKGADKQLVGEIAAQIRARRVPDAYKGKGIKYDYEVLRLKEGKTGA